MRKSFTFSVAALVCLLAAGSAHASFHVMRISEALGQFHGDSHIQFVELQMASIGQNSVGGHKVIFQDASGTKTGEVAFAGAVAVDAKDTNILIGTSAFQTAFGVSVDLLLPEGLMSPVSGRVCWEAIDCLAYGDFTGVNTGFGTPAAGFPADGGQSLTLLTVTPPGPGRDNSANYAFRDASPRNNAGQIGTTPCVDNPPKVVISGPDAVQLIGGTATFALDSSASTDGDQGLQTLSRLWEILSAPNGGNASLDDPGATVVHMNVNAEGSYKVRLTITDSGCNGGQSAAAERTVIASNAPPGGLQKPGDENQDGKLDLSDAVAVLNFLFTGTNPSLACGDGTREDAANIALLDANGDGKIDLSDPVRLLGFLFVGAARPPSCTDDTCPCIRIAGCPDKCL